LGGIYIPCPNLLQEKFVLVVLPIYFSIKLSHYCHADDKGERMYGSYPCLTSALDGVDNNISSLLFEKQLFKKDKLIIVTQVFHI
jgi:hypothetical protein